MSKVKKLITREELDHMDPVKREFIEKVLVPEGTYRIVDENKAEAAS
jgi:hypothetical protein